MCAPGRSDPPPARRSSSTPSRCRLAANYASAVQRADPEAVRTTTATLYSSIFRFDDEVLVNDDRTRRLLERVRAGSPYDPLRIDRPPAEPERRRSPVAHWRHHLRGAVFKANRERREFVEGIGWCVRVRVDPDMHR